MIAGQRSVDFPGFTNIYLIGEFFTGHPFRAAASIGGANPLAVTRGDERLAEPLTLQWTMGRAKPTDLIGTTLAVLIILGPRVIDVLKAESFTGWKTYRVEVHGKAGEIFPGYQGLAVYGRCGEIDVARASKLTGYFPGAFFLCGKGYPSIQLRGMAQISSCPRVSPAISLL